MSWQSEEPLLAKGYLIIRKGAPNGGAGRRSTWSEGAKIVNSSVHPPTHVPEGCIVVAINVNVPPSLFVDYVPVVTVDLSDDPALVGHPPVEVSQESVAGAPQDAP